MSMTVDDGVDLSAVRYVALATRDEDGNFQTFDGHHGVPVFMDYGAAIGIGVIPSHSLFRGFGYRSALTTATNGDDIWQGAAILSPIPNQSVGEQMTVVSTSVDDDSVGANVQKVDHHYLDANGNEQIEEIIMDGTNPVNTSATNIRFSQYIHTKAIGTFGGVAAGDITIYKTGDAARVYNVIKAGGNMSLNTMRMVPVNKTYYMDSITVTSTSSKPVSLRLRATCSEAGELTPGIFLFNEIFSLQDSGIHLRRSIPKEFPALTIIKATAYSTQAGGDATVTYSGWIE